MSIRRARLFWQLFPAWLFITLASLLAISWQISHALGEFYLEQTATELRARARIIEDQARELLRADDEAAATALCRDLARKTDTRFTLIRPDGRVLGDSDEAPELMDNHADREEVIEAMASGFGGSKRYSHTVNQDMQYVAVRVDDAGGRPLGVVRASFSIRFLQQALREARGGILVGMAALALVVSGLGLVFSRRITRPLETLRRQAERFGRGDFTRDLPASDSEEIGGLADAMNHMAHELDRRIQDLVRQRNEEEAILASMVEGVVAVDSEERILRVNQAAARLLGAIDPAAAEGREMREVVRNVDLQRFLVRALQSPRPVEGDVVIFGDEDVRLSLHGSLLRDSEGRSIGALIVLHDVTRLRRLETIRRDFVANVSHELKTPITSIKGFIETLQEGAVDDPAEARRFLAIIAKQSDRLNSIIEDLLSLSRIEQEAGRAEIALKPDRLARVLRAAVQDCQVKAESRGAVLSLDCPEDLMARLNAPLFEQAIDNLIDNAINYSEPGREVSVRAERVGDEVCVRVRDQGCGIAAEHLPRLFERFYRVDKARSRKAGGTGLGLAIVKHIVQAHGGRIDVRSEVGAGSEFAITLPAAREGDDLPVFQPAK